MRSLATVLLALLLAGCSIVLDDRPSADERERIVLEYLAEAGRPWSYEQIEQQATVLCYVLDVDSADIQRTYDRALDESAELLVDLAEGRTTADDPRHLSLLVLEGYIVAPLWCPEHEDEINAVLDR